MLRNLPFLRELPSAFLDSLLGRGTMLKFDRGQVLPRAGLQAAQRLSGVHHVLIPLCCGCQRGSCTGHVARQVDAESIPT